MGIKADYRNVIIERLKQAYIQAASSLEAKKAADAIVCSPDYDGLDNRSKTQVIWYLAGLEDAWYHCKGWRLEDKSWTP